jgi:diguanylate cyclase (GGDEF)-like protein
MMERLQHQATHDALTGLANRVRAGTELGAMLARNDGASSVAVISIDLDDFKNINNSLGHAAGDVVLRAVADRVARVAGEADLAVRSGGDEFLLVLERGHGEAQVTEVAQDLLESLAQPLLVDGRSITVSASAGVAFDHDRSWSAEDLLRNADTAMYRAKDAARQLGRPQITVFESVMHSDSYGPLPANSSRPTTNPSSTSAPSASWAWRHSCAGTTRTEDSWAPTCSSRSPRRAV